MENKLTRIENLIDYVLDQNFCENDAKQYINYLDADLRMIQVLKENTSNNETEMLMNHCIESTILLQQIISLVKNIGE